MLCITSRNGLNLLISPELENSFGIFVAFTNRYGGVSQGPYNSLNLSYNVGDKSSRITANRALVGKVLDIPVEKWVFCQQVHGGHCRAVGALDKGRGSADHWSSIPRTDGLVSRSRDIAIGVLTADCAPVVLIEPTTRTIGVAHAGWKGILSGIVESTMRNMVKFSKGKPREIVSLIGPHIGKCCFKVGDDLASTFKSKFGKAIVYRDKSGQCHLDIGKVCQLKLTDYGVSIKKIAYADICTCCDDGFFTYRGSGGTTGRQMSIVAIR